MRGGFERNKLLGGPFNLLENEKMYLFVDKFLI